jgi:dihydropyrimidinase
MSQHDIYAAYIATLTGGGHPAASGDTSRVHADSNSRDTDLSILKRIEEKLNRLDSGQEMNTPVDLAIYNGLVVIPEIGVMKANVYIRDGKVCALSQQKMGAAKVDVDAAGKYVLPGIIDPHVHLGLFAPLADELITETASALLGGITTVGCYFGSDGSHLNTFPDIRTMVEQHSKTDILPHLVINSMQQREEIPACVDRLGITSFKLYMNGIPGMIPDVDDGFIMDVFDEVKKTGRRCLVCVHSENRYLVARARSKVYKSLGDRATVTDWSDTHPDIAEEEAVIRLAYLAEKSGVPVYFVHISSQAAIDRLKNLKMHNRNLYAETTSPYLSINRDALPGLTGKMEPPFRFPKDVEALWEGIRDGTIDTIGTDNVTMTREEKKIKEGLWKAMPGYPAMGTHLSVMLHEGVHKRGLPIERVVQLISTNPARAFGIYPQKGTLMPGSDGDVVLVDMEKAKAVNTHELGSRSDFSLYEGKRLQGWPVMTIKNGVIAAKDGILTDNGLRGSCLQRNR